MRWQCRVPKWPADNGTVLLPRGSTDARDQEWYPIRSRGGPEQPITEWDPCIVRPPSHLKNARCAKLRPFVFVFFFSSWVLGNPVRLLRTEVEVGVRHFIRRIRFYLHSGQMTVSLTVSKIPMYPENLGTFTHLWYGVLGIYVVGVHFVHAASCRGKEKKRKSELSYWPTWRHEMYDRDGPYVEIGSGASGEKSERRVFFHSRSAQRTQGSA